MSLYPFLVAAHVTVVVFFVGGMLGYNRMIAGMSGKTPETQAPILIALIGFDRLIVTPALLLTWAFGVTLALWADWFASPWLMTKLVIVVALSAFHGMQSGQVRRSIRYGKPVKPIRGLGIGIVIAMLIIGILAIAKPI